MICMSPLVYHLGFFLMRFKRSASFSSLKEQADKMFSMEVNGDYSVWLLLLSGHMIPYSFQSIKYNTDSSYYSLWRAIWQI